MSPFIPPNNPPALIEPIAPEKVGKSLQERCNHCSDSVDLLAQATDISQGKPIPTDAHPDSNSTLSSSLPPLQPHRPLAKPREATPEVVEFYYADPKEVAVPPLPNTVDSTQKSAQSLGHSISIGHETSAPSQAQVVKGLAEIRLTGDPQVNKVLVTRQRGGAVREFQLMIAQESVSQTETSPNSTAQPAPVNVVEVIADRQEYDSQGQIITATGNVEIRFTNGVLVADRVQVNLPDRVAVAQGEVILTRGDQVLRGERFEYYFVQDSGVILNANGEIYQPTTGRDLSPTLPTDVGSDITSNQTLSDRLALNQPLQRVTTAEGYRFVVGNLRDLTLVEQQSGAPRTSVGGRINRVRFQADRVDFEADSWTATNVRLTNDPFSPPELELRAETATYRNIAPLVDELTLTDSRIVFDQSFSVPTFQDRLVFDRRSRQPGLFSIGYDGTDRGGLYLERGFNIIETEKVSLRVKPQYLLQRVILPDTFATDDDIDEDVGVFSPSAFGLVANFEINFSERTTFQGAASFSSLDFEKISGNLRARVQLQQKIGDLNHPYDLRLAYNYRDRLFNGSLGFQTVNSSIGAIVVSPTIPLGDTGVNLSYQASIEHIEASTDRQDLLESDHKDDLIDLTRYQGAASISRGFMLWQGEALPPTPEEGLRYTPTPVQPYLQLTTGLTGVASYYSSGDSQPSLTGSVGILGQLGHFSRPFLDYTGFNITYSQGLRGDASPFLFDRFVDTKTLTWGITQQIYGPIRVGVQSSLSLNDSEEISTDYFIEFSRRTYNILLRYNPVLEIGSINLRISDFNWSGNPGTLDGTDIRPVIRGVTR
jgi:hypothetical protein